MFQSLENITTTCVFYFVLIEYRTLKDKMLSIKSTKWAVQKVFAKHNIHRRGFFLFASLVVVSFDEVQCHGHVQHDCIFPVAASKSAALSFLVFSWHVDPRRDVDAADSPFLPQPVSSLPFPPSSMYTLSRWWTEIGLIRNLGRKLRVYIHRQLRRCFSNRSLPSVPNRARLRDLRPIPVSTCSYSGELQRDRCYRDLFL